MGLHTQRTRWRCCVGLPGRALPPASPPSQGRPRPPQPGAACSSPALSPAALQVLLGSEVSEKHHSPLAPAFPLKRSSHHGGGSAAAGARDSAERLPLLLLRGGGAGRREGGKDGVSEVGAVGADQEPG
uniref:Uncharacterized protein n=1 Tax=Rangifer tarandus platyrhynchus TaxID=3082113 RepID=A0ACB0F7S3_RANTA|nr:unnamed protein product [Rangifer tarandus platyrhynchus]